MRLTKITLAAGAAGLAMAAAALWPGVASANDGHQASANQRVYAEAVMREHASLGVAALKAEYLNEPDLPALKGAVEQNNQAVVDVVEWYYPGARDEALALWRAHIQYYRQYLAAAAHGDAAGKYQAKAHLMGFADRFSTLLANHSNVADKWAIQQQLNAHGAHVTTIIDNLVAGNYNGVWAHAHEAYWQAGVLADVIADGGLE
jgi:hypothetical protein